MNVKYRFRLFVLTINVELLGTDRAHILRNKLLPRVRKVSTVGEDFFQI